MGQATKDTQTCKHTYIPTDTEPVCAEIGQDGRLMLLVALNCVVGTATMMSVMDYSGKLAKKTLLYLWKNSATKWSLMQYAVISIGQ